LTPAARSTNIVAMGSTLPLFPSDDGWPYPDATGLDLAADAVDFDALEMLGPHAYDALDASERDALFLHFGLQGNHALTMKELGPALGCSRTEARALVGTAIDKVRVQLLAE
jgi:DNA-directed RNA polymerase sigma subunit (sigma70/sigma32)